MANLTVQKVKEPERSKVPIFQRIAERFEEVRRRAYDLFEKRGSEVGHDLDDWFQAEREIMGASTAEIAEKDGGYEVEMTLPGFESKDVEVTAASNEIIIHAQAQHSTKSDRVGVVGTQFESKEVYRRLETPGPVDVDKIEATLDKGVLRITVPKQAAAAPAKAIAVKAA